MQLVPPDGLTDNITWSFGSGPRQTVSQDGSFSHGASAQKQRIFNHTGIFDEHHDFERNTRDVSGGLGAITTAPTLAECNQLDKETQVALAINGVAIGGVAKPLEELADDPAVATCGHKDRDDIDSFVANAGNANFSLELAKPGTLDDLTAFLLAIDAQTPELSIPNDLGTGASFDACP